MIDEGKRDTIYPAAREVNICIHTKKRKEIGKKKIGEGMDREPSEEGQEEGRKKKTLNYKRKKIEYRLKIEGETKRKKGQSPLLESHPS